ncbi:MAG: glutamate--tRNA ligase [Gammaproteobacteria bacterium]|jgi:glutamyl-tRNA synthetase|nr:glutamate--tRNA ligase [Gammaproteobacteria bacterium]
MQTSSAKFRFCPSPTGLIHFGNVRTALFNALLAHKLQGTFLLRIEDTDKERSKSEYTEALMADLHWLGLEWQEGPEVGGNNGPYWQSERQAIYDNDYQRLGLHAYPCFCSEQDLEAMRKVQRSQGQPPRYAGTCRHLSTEEITVKIAAGEKPALRFRVPDGEAVEFIDLAKGPQRFLTDDIGDFIIRRADGTAPFMYCNAIDDAMMGVTHVVRGEDHLTNTPRQILILQALGLRVPQYCHISLIMGADHTPLSKRNGSRNMQTLRAEGYLPLAIVNYLARLGHYYSSEQFMSLAQLAAGFDFNHLSRSAAHFDEQQLLHWQKEAVMRLSPTAFKLWIGEHSTQFNLIPPAKHELFLKIIQPNIVFPKEFDDWATRLYAETLPLEPTLRDVLLQAHKGFFMTAIAAVKEKGVDYAYLQQCLQQECNAKGRSLFQPLRVALTASLHGPQLEDILQLMGREQVLRRFAAAALLKAEDSSC